MSAPQDQSLTEVINDLAGRRGEGLEEILRLAAQGDWRRRACALSAAGRIAATESFAASFIGSAARLLPGGRLRRRCAGFRGRGVRNDIANALVDRSWPVRVAAALASGECRSPTSVVQLRRSLDAPFRAERIAAAAALRACGAAAPGLPELVATAEPVPPRIDRRTTSMDFLAAMAGIHTAVLSNVFSSGVPVDQRAAEMAGAGASATSGGLQAEVDRYDVEGETAYLLRKPFSHINRGQNVRLLHSFLAAAEHLSAPPGGRVLDLGGGSAWVSEMLEKLGYRAFTLDIASALLRIGQQRLTREGLTSRCAAADMMNLPVASASMDGAIVMDALHHVPDVSAVLREVFRVLKEGGVCVIAEPGEGHSETERSRAEMLEHGVQEAEIHVFETMALGRTAGFDDVRIVPHYVPAISMTPAQLANAMKSPAESWLVKDADATRRYARYVMQAMLDRPILVFRKGSRPIDSRLPGHLRAQIAPKLVRTGTRVAGSVSVRNAGDTLWLGGANDVGSVFLGVHLLTLERHVLRQDFGRVLLPAALAPDASIDLQIEIELPSAGDAYVLKLDMVSEGVCWFEEKGSPPVYVTV